MEVIGNVIGRIINYLSTIGIADLVDIVLVAYIIFRVLWFARRESAYNLAKGLAVFLLILWLSGLFNLTMINYLLRKAVEIGAIALIILFQPELRKLLERLGAKFTAGRTVTSTAVETAIMQTVLACKDLSASRTGALIVFERNVALNDVINTGTILNADVAAELLKNLFFNKAPLHDGAVIIKENRIVAAGCVLPLTKTTNLSKELGMRHRAGIGMSEHSDAVVLIVSEETGAISVAVDGLLKRHLDETGLDTLLRQELIVGGEEKSVSLLSELKSILFVTNDK